MADSRELSPGGCIFCAVARGDERPHIVFEDRDILAVLDIQPIREGHVQIIPREHVPYFEALSPRLANKILAVGQRIAKAQKRLYGVERVSFLFTGGDIAHVHAHVVPMVEKTDITSRRYIKERTLTFGPLPCADRADLDRVRTELSAALSETS